MTSTLHEELGLNRIPLRLHFIYLRTCVVSCGERPSSLPFCHYISWQKLDKHRARVYFIRLDLPGDGHKLRLRHRRSRLDEQIVCAKRLAALPPRKYRHRPTRAQRRCAQRVLKVHLEVWHRWAAEFEPIPTWRDRWSRWFGPGKHARQIVLASETKIRWLSPLLGCDSYAKVLWHYPRQPNVIHSRDIKDRFAEIIGFFEIDPHRQLDLQKWCQRIIVLDHSNFDRKHFFGVHSNDYRDCAVLDLLNPGCEIEPMVESHLKLIDDYSAPQLRKRKFLDSVHPQQ
jgi:hypothetical protein